jgi:Flp pilus assembly protein TadD
MVLLRGRDRRGFAVMAEPLDAPTWLHAWGIPTALVALCMAVFGQTVGFGFIRLDDPAYVAENPHVLGGITAENLGWAFTTFHRSNWHPLTWVSLQLDAALGGGRPALFHATNVALHAAGTCLLYLFFFRTTRRAWPAALAAALFAVHPLHVESVAWVTERKDVLSTVFLLASLLAYSRWAARASPAAYAVALAAAAAGLLAKPMLVTLPVLLLLVSYWPLGRLGTTSPRRLVLEVAPFAVLAAASCGMTLLAQARGGALGSFEDFPMSVRLANAVVATMRYLALTLWPAGLALPYPYDVAALGAGKVAAAALGLLAISGAVWRLCGRWPSLVFGWAWYLVTLIPVLGLVQVGTQALADRYTYVPLIGIFAGVAYALPDARSGRARARVVFAVAVLVLVGLVIAAWIQAGLWSSSTTLFAHAARVTSNNAVALNVLGLEALDAARTRDAVAHFRAALAAAPRFAEAHNNLATALLRTGDSAEALAHFREAVRLRPAEANSRANLGILLDQRGDTAEAERQLVEALRLDPRDLQARGGYGLLLARAGRDAEALPLLEGVVREAPDDVPARLNLATVLLRAGRPADAVAPLEQALRLEPRNARGRLALGIALTLLGRSSEAEAQFAEALRLEPDNEVARDYLNRIRMP